MENSVGPDLNACFPLIMDKGVVLSLSFPPVDYTALLIELILDPRGLET